MAQNDDQCQLQRRCYDDWPRGKQRVLQFIFKFWYQGYRIYPKNPVYSKYFFLKCTSARVWHPGPRNFASFWMVLVPVPEKFGPKKSTGTRKFSSQKKVPVSVPEKFGTVTLWQVLHSCLSYLNHARIGLVFFYVFFDNPAQKYFQIIRRKIFLDNPAQNIVG